MQQKSSISWTERLMKNNIQIPIYLAMQSIRRGRKWTIALTIVLMSVAFVNLIFVSALFNGILEGGNRQTIEMMSGEVYITPQSGSLRINDKAELIEKIKSIEGVVDVASGYQLPAKIEHNSRSGAWALLAINPIEYAKVIGIHNKMYSGEYLEENDADQVILGRQIVGGEDVELDAASLRGVEVGEKVDITVNGVMKDFTVKGIFYTKFIESDIQSYITEQALASFAPNVSLDDATILKIKTLDTMQNSVIEKIRSIDSSLEVHSWTEAAGITRSASKSFDSVNAILTIVGTVVAAATIFIVVYVEVINRRRQIGIMRAIGISPAVIVTSYVILAVFYAVMGIALGSLFYYILLVPYVDAHPFELPLVDVVLNLSWVDYVSRIELVLVAAILSGLIPAIIVTRTKMIDAIVGK
jgi:putative ABC transport system permease protein